MRPVGIRELRSRSSHATVRAAVGAALCLAAAGCGFAAGAPAAPTRPSARPVSLSGSTLAGSRFSLASEPAVPVVISFWATWCEPCTRDAPALVRAAALLRPAGVVFVGVAEESPTVSIRQFLTRYGVGYPTIADPDGTLRLLIGGTSGLPETVVLDSDHRVGTRLFGAVTTATLLAAVARAGHSDP